MATNARRPVACRLLLLSCAALAMTAAATAPTPRTIEPNEPRAVRPARGTPEATASPLQLQSTENITWLRVHPAGQSPCAPEDASGSQTAEHVWCFDRPGGDSTWPAAGTQGSGTWNHWAKFNPPVPDPSKWHVTTRGVGAAGGTYAAWCGCDSLGTTPGCDVSQWLFKEGYGDEWNYALELDMSGQNASAGGTIEFDLMYDVECNYDYLVLEYRNSTTGLWQPVTGPNGSAYFNAVSGNPDLAHGGTGRSCGDDYFFHSDQKDLGFGNILYYGNATWLTDVVFALPAQAGGMRLRWRGTSDGAWSDSDGNGDTDGIGRIDNVTVTFTASGAVVEDDFETGDFAGVTATSGAATWLPQPLQGNPYDGWHVEFDPKYKNRGNSCVFSNDWMWAAKPAAFAIPSSANGFDYLLVSPAIAVTGWLGGVVEYSSYHCTPNGSTTFVDVLARRYDPSAATWTGWESTTDFIIFDDYGCDAWRFDQTRRLDDFVGPGTDSLQIAWQLMDYDLAWGPHTSVNYLIDNVSIGRLDPTGTVFTARSIDLLSDTFSLVDPAHTAFLQNGEEGDWIGNGGSRAFADVDSLSVAVEDPDGITAANVRLFYRLGTGTPPVFGAWTEKAMVFSDPKPLSASDEGTYRGTFGNTTAEDFSAAEGTPDPIFDPGSTVEYYLKVTDDVANTTTFPASASATPTPDFLRLQILPFARTAAGQRILVVDDYNRAALDVESSAGFNPTGGVGFGSFTLPAYDEPENMVERALALIYGGSEDVTAGVYGSPKWDIYNVAGAGSSIQREPRVLGDSASGLGGIADASGTPQYDAVIWLQGTFDAYSYADSTRIGLKAFLDAGGKMFSSGDDVAYFLGASGQNADSTVQFLGPYFGTAFTNINDDLTADRVVVVTGVIGTSISGLWFNLYGECPEFRHSFDRLTLAPNVPSEHVNTVLATYEFGDPATNGRAAIIKNVRVAGGGVAVHCGFGVESLRKTRERACLLSRVLAEDFGLTAPDPGPGGCPPGLDAPVVAASRFGFELAAATPNPFRETTAIRFSVPSRTRVSVEVYNILGQRVRQLVDETLESNTYVREWDGRAEDGTPVSSGIYFTRMTAGDYSATRRVVRLR